MAVAWKRTISMAFAAVLTTAGIAALPVVAASSAETPREVQGRDRATSMAAGSPVHRTSPMLAPPTHHPVDEAVVSAARAGGGGGASVTEVISLEIIGGSLTVEPPTRSVTLHRVPGSRNDWSATLPPVDVVDARGSHDGWTLLWHVDRIELAGSSRDTVPPAKVRLTPGDVTVIAGEEPGLEPGRAHPARKKGRTLLSAERGWGAGTYRIGGELSLRLPASIEANAVTIDLSFTV